MNRSARIDSPNALDAVASPGHPARMEDLTLYRIDPARNMARFYALSIEPTLFGGRSLTRRWGRVGTQGRQIVELHADAQAAVTAMRSWHDAKCRRGYEQLR